MDSVAEQSALYVKSGLEDFEMISFSIENLRRAARHGLLPGKLD